MPKIFEASLTKVQSLTIAKFIALFGIATFLPMFIHLQWLTGPIVNAILIITVVVVGVREALLLALIPSTIALAQGLLPLPLAPMVPFIMISNALLVWIFDMLRDKNYWLGVIVGALVKFVFLYFIARVVMGAIIAEKFFTLLLNMMGLAQFVTAVIGGIIAWGFLKFLKFKV